MHPQLTLAFDASPATSFDTFHVDASNELVSQSVEAFVRGTLAERQLLIWGEAGVGKSHLLTSACQSVSEQGYLVAYLSGELANAVDALVGLEQCELVCIDDLQLLDRSAEESLFNCINRCRGADTRLLFAADRQPDELGLQLRDLTTRLTWGPRFQLNALGEDALIKALRKEIQSRSLEASDEVLNYVLRRFPRHMPALKRLVDRLDSASMSEQRRLTIPFVRSVCGG
ncbi:MAG: DnaA regulatory inactivator Hda [Granulosicoccus sp.]